MTKEIVEHRLNIPPDYQYYALQKGKCFQKQWHRNRLILIEELHFLNLRAVVADIGCGSGNVVFAFAGKVKSIVGFDYNTESVEFLATKIKSDGIINSDASTLDILDAVPELYRNKFDKIIFNEVIEHFDKSEVETVLSNLSKMLKTGGEILITTPNYGISPWTLIELLIDKFKMFPALLGEQHRVKFTLAGLESYCKSAGFFIKRKGTFSLLSVLLAVFGAKFAEYIVKVEVNHLKYFGPQIFLVARK